MTNFPEDPTFDNPEALTPGAPIYIQLQGFAELDEDNNLQFTNPKFNEIVVLPSVKQTVFSTTVGDKTIYFANALIPFEADIAEILTQPTGLELPTDVPGVVIVKPPKHTDPMPINDEILVSFVYAQYNA